VWRTQCSKCTSQHCVGAVPSSYHTLSSKLIEARQTGTCVQLHKILPKATHVAVPHMSLFHTCCCSGTSTSHAQLLPKMVFKVCVCVWPQWSAGVHLLHDHWTPISLFSFHATSPPHPTVQAVGGSPSKPAHHPQQHLQLHPSPHPPAQLQPQHQQHASQSLTTVQEQEAAAAAAAAAVVAGTRRRLYVACE
jgi:hypothetical protein